jgi:DNA-binding MarR family transcriptional regulator
MNALRKVLGVVEAFRDADKEMPVQQAEILLWVSMYPGISSKDLQNRTGLSQSSISRHLAALGKWHYAKRPGLEFVSTVEDPRERRRKVSFLTPRGKKFVERTCQTIDPDFAIQGGTEKDEIGKLYEGYRHTR